MQDDLIFKKHPLEMDKGEMKSAAKAFIESLTEDSLKESMNEFGYSEERIKREVSDILFIREIEMEKFHFDVENKKTIYTSISLNSSSLDIKEFPREDDLKKAA